MKLSWSRWRRDLLAGLIGAGFASGVCAVTLHQMHETHQVKEAEWKEEIEKSQKEADESLRAAFRAEMELLKKNRMPATSGPLRGIPEPQ
jgi:hypothetical protein